jgi:hypothetical protein
MLGLDLERQTLPYLDGQVLEDADDACPVITETVSDGVTTTHLVGGCSSEAGATWAGELTIHEADTLHERPTDATAAGTSRWRG